MLIWSLVGAVFALATCISASGVDTRQAHLRQARIRQARIRQEKRDLVATQDLLVDLKVQLAPIKVEIEADMAAIVASNNPAKKNALGLDLIAKLNVMLDVFHHTHLSSLHPAPSGRPGWPEHPQPPSCNLLGLLFTEVADTVIFTLTEVETVLTYLPDLEETIRDLFVELDAELATLLQSLLATVFCLLEIVLNLINTQDLEHLKLTALIGVLLG